MADSVKGVKGDGTRSRAEETIVGTNEASNGSTGMDVDLPTEILSNEQTNKSVGVDATENLNVEEKGKVQNTFSDKPEEDEFLVVEEDDGEEEGDQGNKSTGKINETFKTPEPEPMDASSASAGDQENPPEDALCKGDGDKDDEVLLVNPLFGKDHVPVPVIEIESSSSSSDDDDDEEEDFSLDVSVNNFQQPGNDGEILLNGDSADGGAGGVPPPAHKRANKKGCNCDCYHEKGILVNEIERLRRAVFEINERHSVLEDFIEVEYSESFDKFLKNREHLVSMGFGGKDSEGSEDIIDGKRGAKSAELIELLKMIKEQATANIKEEPDTSVNALKKPSSSNGGGGSSSSQSNKNQQKAKPIPSVTSFQRDRGSGRGGALSYSQRPVFVQHAVSNVQAMNYQYQQQLLAQQEAQARQYYESMYGHTGGVRDSRDIITAVGRTELYPSSGSSSYGYGNYGTSNKESKKQRKRKRQSEVSSEASSSSKNIPNSGKSQQSGASTKKTIEPDDDIEIVDYSSDLNVNAKRICPLCEKIINRKGLRDHLSIVHQGHKVACPVCQAEFMNRKRIKTHMRDSHDLPVSEYSAYINKIYSNIEEQCGPWLDKLMQEAETPTKDQLIVHNAEIQLAMITRREQKAAAAATTSEGSTVATSSSSMKAPPQSRPSASSSASRAAPLSSSSGGGRKDNRDPRNKSSRGGSASHSSSQPVRYFTGINPKVSTSKGHGGGHRSGGGRMDVSSEELYGPGGYAQYAARYLQQRAATGSSGVVGRIYTPF